MLPLSRNLFVRQGTDFSSQLSLQTKEGTPFDLTGYALTSYVKKYHNTEKVYESTVTVTNEIEGEIEFSMSRLVTSEMDAERYVYCIKAEKNNIILTIVFGHILMERF